LKNTNCDVRPVGETRTGDVLITIISSLLLFLLLCRYSVTSTVARYPTTARSFSEYICEDEAIHVCARPKVQNSKAMALALASVCRRFSPQPSFQVKVNRTFTSPPDPFYIKCLPVEYDPLSPLDRNRAKGRCRESHSVVLVV